MTTQTPDAVREAIVKYTQHYVGCAVYGSWADGEPKCSCGLDEARASLAALDSRAGDAGEAGPHNVPSTGNIFRDHPHSGFKALSATPAPAVDAGEKLTLNPTPLEKIADDMTGGDPVNDMAIRLMRAWANADPRSGVAQYPASYIANFACMADAVVTPAVDAVPAGEVRLRMFLDILSAAGGTSDCSEWPGAWTNAFCETHEGQSPDTFNTAIDKGYTRSTYDADRDHGTVTLTAAGRAHLASLSHGEGRK